MAYTLQTRTCVICGKQYQGSHKSMTCSYECRKRYKTLQHRDRRAALAEDSLNGIDGVDYVTCPICGMKAKRLTQQHFDRHNITIDEVKRKYPEFKVSCQKYIDENFSGQNHPRSATNISKDEIRECSPYCPEFYIKRGHSVEESAILAKEKSKESIDIRVSKSEALF